MVVIDRNMMLTPDEYMSLMRLISSERESEGASLAISQEVPAKPKRRSRGARSQDKKLSQAFKEANATGWLIVVFIDGFFIDKCGNSSDGFPTFLDDPTSTSTISKKLIDLWIKYPIDIFIKWPNPIGFTFVQPNREQEELFCCLLI